jgi:hypothetical protein
MKTLRWTLVLPLVVWFVISAAGQADAANGTLRYLLKYKDPATGGVITLTDTWAYLRNASAPPPMEKFFSKADIIVKTSLNTGMYQASIPEGTYFLRITQRKTRTGINRQLGPPENGDYTWMQTMPITIVAGQTTNLNTLYGVLEGSVRNLYASLYASAPITITGTVRSPQGLPVAGQYVRAQTEPCRDDGYNYDINQCGPVKNLALAPTDANGTYTMQLKNPGTYYIYASPCVTAQHDMYTGNRCDYTAAPGGPFTVTMGGNLTVNITVY